ncbi:ANTAR domain-containing protein [Egicoccus sp. AB-alg2]|uniref:ANTAR domain-containing protein n=1 Tax=Egicoccus sp. AB-alg2 TaxID=3242693 RepID=UPI00359E2E95
MPDGPSGRAGVEVAAVVDASLLVAVLGDFAGTVAVRHDPDRLAAEVLGPLCRLLTADAAAISLVVGDGLRFVAATGPETARFERRQLATEHSPASEALRQVRGVTCGDLGVDPRWPELVPVALEAGARALVAVPLSAAGSSVGVVTVLARAPRVWETADLVAVTAFAELVAACLLVAGRSSARARLAAQLQHALERRVVVEQAKGMLAERHGTTPEVAYERLRRHAREHQTKVATVARAVLDGRSEP